MNKDLRNAVTLIAGVFALGFWFGLGERVGAGSNEIDEIIMLRERVSRLEGRNEATS